MKGNPFQDTASKGGLVMEALHIVSLGPTSVPNLVGNPAAHELAMKIKRAVGQGACRILSSTELVARQCIHSNFEQRSLTMSIEINQKMIVTDKDGYLINAYQWEPAVAEAMADSDSVKLTEPHWEVIRFLRDYYEEYEVAPDLRTLSKALNGSLGADKGSKTYLAGLFSESPAKTACRYAGLPKPISGACV
jgi:tRNA 2-thiouridine synthesizing protein E